MRMLRLAWICAASYWWQASYAVRPYDMIADQRRWFWQPRTPCPRRTDLWP